MDEKDLRIQELEEELKQLQDRYKQLMEVSSSAASYFRAWSTQMHYLIKQQSIPSVIEQEEKINYMADVDGYGG